ncbi:hypothetical protein [Nonomuraea africana]|uniref:hypothetical protein n=1 Tax=Nonomuraea africana TaxID=46171 RepID=UPI0033D9F909
MERAVDGFFAKYGRRGRKLERIWRPWVEAMVAEYGVAMLDRLEVGIEPCAEDQAAQATRERLYTLKARYRRRARHR